MTGSLLTYLSRSCKQHPAKIAVKYKSVDLSYRDLDKKSNQLASLLIHAGVTAGQRIGIYMDKSPEAVIAIFAILKTGSCYVPLDPSAPAQRLEQLIANCRLEYIITSGIKSSVMSNIATRIQYVQHLVVIDTERSGEIENSNGICDFYKDDLEQAPDAAIKMAEQVSRHDLAYILYTSGSTGQPKGVMISHGAACAFVDWAQKSFQLEGADVFSAHAPLHFDLSILDVFAAIAAGATICLIPQGWSAFPKTIAEFIVKNGITTWYSVPTALIQLMTLGTLGNYDFSCLKRILFAGEVFPSKYLRQLMHLLPEADYFNLYGPTETNVVTYHQVTEPPAAEDDLPIGVLCDGVTGYVVSHGETLAPRGKIGELYIKGPTLMDGYWSDNRKTSEVLFQNPFEPEDKSLVYRTGDLVHQDINGLLAYHGRRDTMVKSRGYRIELVEIEKVLNAHPGIRESVAVALPSEMFGSIIAANVVSRSGSDLDEENVQRFCREKLPVYMVPEKVCFIEALPRTSTGKIDRQAMVQSSM